MGRSPGDKAKGGDGQTVQVCGSCQLLALFPGAVSKEISLPSKNIQTSGKKMKISLTSG